LAARVKPFAFMALADPVIHAEIPGHPQDLHLQQDFGKPKVFCRFIG
jgi:hypothetical protein